MSKAWTILTRRYGSDVRSPSSLELAATVGELYHENLPGMATADYAEHGDATLRYGHIDGPMFVLTINRRGDVRFEEWADQDFAQELSPPKEMQSVSEGEALELWELLAGGNIEALRSRGWEKSG